MPVRCIVAVTRRRSSVTMAAVNAMGTLIVAAFLLIFTRCAVQAAPEAGLRLDTPAMGNSFRKTLSRRQT